MKILILALVAVTMPTHAFADEPVPRLLPYVVMAAGNVADVWSTKVALDRGGSETYPLMANAGIGRIVSQKAAATAGVAVLMRMLETHGHPTAAKLIGYVYGGALFGVAAHNARVAR